MAFPGITAAYAGVFGLLYLVLSGWVIGGRVSFRVLHGDGGQAGLGKRIRAHANFNEYVPLVLLLAGLLEARGTAHAIVHALLAPLLLARVAHPVGMMAREMSPLQGICRGIGTVVTLTVLGVASILLLAG